MRNVTRKLVYGEPDKNSTPRVDVLSLDQMLVRFVYIVRGQLVADSDRGSSRTKVAEFRSMYAASKTPVGKTMVPTTALWFSNRNRLSVDRIGFDPSKSDFFLDGGLHHLNTWKAPTWDKVDTASAQPLFDHFDYLVPSTSERNALLDWLAHAVQFPEIRPHVHFLLLASREGTGRSWIGEVVRRIWGAALAGEVDLHRLLDDSFNSCLSQKIMMIVNEVKAPSSERYAHKDRIKALFTDTIITVNEKHEPRWTEKFCARFLMFTNRDDALPIAESDRRLHVVRCADQPKSPAYYTTLYGHLNDDRFLAAVWHALKQRDISKFNPGLRPPLTDTKLQMIAAGRTEEQQDAAAFVHACPHDIVDATSLFRIMAPEREHERANDRQSRTLSISHVLREVGAQTYIKKVKVGGTSKRIWILRNAERWQAATPAAIGEAAAKAAADIAHGWNVDSLLDQWSDDSL